MKKILAMVSVVVLSTTLYSEDLVDAVADVMKAKIQADAEVAKSQKATVKVENSVLATETKMGNDNVVVGNTGIVAVGGEITIENSVIKTETEMGNENVVIGNTGVVLGAH